ncbi:MAG: LPS export ABC transporter permease LptF [Pseudomonadota bacterium]
MVSARQAFRELTVVMAVLLVVFILIGLGGRFIGYLQDAAAGKFAPEVVLTLIGLRLPEFLQLVAPLALFLAVVMALGRWYAENEYTVLLAAGASPTRMLGWFLFGAVLVASATGLLTLVVTPQANARLDATLIEERKNRELRALTPGVFLALYEGQRVSYTEALDPVSGRLDNVFIGERLDTGVRVTLWAATGSQYTNPETGSQYLELRDGHRYQGFPGTAAYRVLAFDTLSQRVNQRDIRRRRLELSILPTAELRPLATPAALTEWHWRWSLPLTTLIGAVLAYSLARSPPRSGRYARVLPAISVFLLYFLLLLLARQAGEDGRLPPAVGLWGIHCAFALLAWGLFRRGLRPH